MLCGPQARWFRHAPAIATVRNVGSALATLSFGMQVILIANATTDAASPI